MSDSKGADGTPNNSTDGQNLENDKLKNSTNTDGMVAFSTYDKVMKRLKSLESEREELQTFKQQKEQEVLEAQGKYEDLVKSLRTENESLKKEKTNIYADFATKSVSQQIELEAKNLGCVDTKALKKLVDLSSLDVDSSTFEANPDTVKGLIEQAKQEMPYLFSKSAPNINTDNAKSTFDQNKKSVAEMTPEEREALVRAIDKKEGKTLGW